MVPVRCDAAIARRGGASGHRLVAAKKRGSLEDTGDRSGKDGLAPSRPARLRPDPPAGRRLLWLVVAVAVGGLTLTLVGVLSTVFALFLLIEARVDDRRTEADLANRASRSPRRSRAVCAVVARAGDRHRARARLADPGRPRPAVRPPDRAHPAHGPQRDRRRALPRWRPSILPWGVALRQRRRGVPADVDADHRLRAVPALPVEREHAADGHDPGAAARHRDVARPRRRRSTRRTSAIGSRGTSRSSRTRTTASSAPGTVEGDRVVTFGGYPDERGVDLEPAYDLDAASRRRATSSRPTSRTSSTSTTRDADPAEVAYLGEHRPSDAGDAPARRARRVDRHRRAELDARSDAFTDRDVELAQLLVREAVGRRSTTRGCTTSCASSPTATR